MDVAAGGGASALDEGLQLQLQLQPGGSASVGAVVDVAAGGGASALDEGLQLQLQLQPGGVWVADGASGDNFSALACASGNKTISTMGIK